MDISLKLCIFVWAALSPSNIAFGASAVQSGGGSATYSTHLPRV